MNTAAASPAAANTLVTGAALLTMISSDYVSDTSSGNERIVIDKAVFEPLSCAAFSS
jgi:hypothetical protein